MLLENIDDAIATLAPIENDPTSTLRTLQLAIEASTHYTRPYRRDGYPST